MSRRSTCSTSPAAVAGAARAGEQVEAYVVRTRETDVEVFGGEVESLTTASVEGVGIRVIADHRQGLAWAGSLDARRHRRDAAAKRATTPAFGEPDEWYGLASPADVERRQRRPSSTCGATSSSSVPTEEKVRIALELERATKAADPRIRNVESASYGDALGRGRARELARRRGAHPPHDVLGVGGRARRRRLGHAVGLRVRRRPHARRSRSRLDPARRGHARVPPARRQARPGSAHPGDPRPARDPFGARRAVERVQRRVDAEGPFAVRGPRRRDDRRADRAADRRPHRPARARRVAVRRRRRPDAPQRADRRRRDAGLPAQRLHGPPFGLGHDRERDARHQLDARSRRAGAAARARRRSRPRRSCAARARRSTCSR